MPLPECSKKVECSMQRCYGYPRYVTVILLFLSSSRALLIYVQRAGAASAPSKNWLSLKNEEEMEETAKLVPAPLRSPTLSHSFDVAADSRDNSSSSHYFLPSFCPTCSCMYTGLLHVLAGFYAATFLCSGPATGRAREPCLAAWLSPLLRYVL